MTSTTTTCPACQPPNSVEYHGGCPTCQGNDGYINIGRGHWFYCAEHRVCWFTGSNLFSSWRDETEAEQRATYDRLGFDTFTRIEPVFNPADLLHVCAGQACRPA